MLYGIDVSSHNMAGSGFNAKTENAYQRSDFVIVKATQGVGYEFPMMASIIKRARTAGKFVGTYHYAGGQNAVPEADYYWQHVKAYNGIAVPVLDFEQYQNKRNWNNTSWALDFVTRYHELSGVWPMVYVSASERRRVARCADKCALWVAGYPTNADSWSVPRFTYKVSPWSTYTVWQFTSGGGIDRNVGNITRDGWKLLAQGGDSTSDVSGTTVELAGDVLAGKYGDGDARKQALGARYSEVQAQVNHVLTATVSVLGSEVIKGLYGNGDARRHNLGSRYEEVQKYVNQH